MCNCNRMLFNSPEFIFLFLPAAVILHFSLARFGPEVAAFGTSVSSLIFYAWWNPSYVVLPVFSILANLWIAQRILRTEHATARFLLISGIVANLLVLSHYKYSHFLLSIFDGRTTTPPNVPLALSFTTFVQIAFLVHVYQQRRVPEFHFYALFVAFFPHLIAGPIVRWSSLGSQLTDPDRYRLNWNNVALGLTIFVLGLAKKVLVADQLSPHVGLLFDAAARGEPLTTLATWLGCFAFSLQVYFDFSGYSDMAIGLGLLFNFKLPINFAAPFRSPNIFELWRRWHITLSRLARDLIYVPLAAGHDSKLRRSASLMLTMIVIGLWHGAGSTFVVWGAFNGVLLLVNQAWRWLRGHRMLTPGRRLFSCVLTFTAFAFGMAFFRAADLETSWHLIKAMLGFSTRSVTQLPLDWDAWGIEHGYFSKEFILAWLGSSWSAVGTLWLAGAFLIVFFIPDTIELVDYRESDAQSRWRRDLGKFVWRPSLGWALAAFTLTITVLVRIGSVREFLYFQF
jgi:D-alanyl-lipoteichoic acid acyltransferase DltB (MBOAT superfamily)